MKEETILKVNNLCQYFNVNRSKVFKAVDGVSFEVKKGEVFGIVGESGSGKTTIGRSIMGLYDITSGEIYYKGSLINSGVKSEKKILKRERKRISGDIQMIFQDPYSSLNPRMTAKEIISEGLIIRGEKDKKIIDEKVNETMSLVGLNKEYLGRYPHEFSGGQRQRIGIARAIIMKPEIIIADEPVSALDVSIQAQVINLLNDLREKLELTLIFIAHDLSVVKYFSTRIGVMYKGKIVEMAPSEELFKNPLHPYTKSLLSAIPIPNPKIEKRRKRIVYNPIKEHDYIEKKPSMHIIENDHSVYCSDEELKNYLRKNDI